MEGVNCLKLYYFISPSKRRLNYTLPYILDFVCFEKQVIIEIDGGQHLVNVKDKKRDEWLQSQEYNVLRFWNNEVLTNIKGVLEIIMINLYHPPLTPPIEGGGIVGKAANEENGITYLRKNITQNKSYD